MVKDGDDGMLCGDITTYVGQDNIQCDLFEICGLPTIIGSSYNHNRLLCGEINVIIDNCFTCGALCGVIIWRRSMLVLWILCIILLHLLKQVVWMFGVFNHQPAIHLARRIGGGPAADGGADGAR